MIIANIRCIKFNPFGVKFFDIPHIFSENYVKKFFPKILRLNLCTLYIKLDHTKPNRYRAFSCQS